MLKDFFINPLILKGWSRVMMMMMMVQSCQSIPKALPPLSPALHPPDQQQSFKQKPKHLFLSLRRSRFFRFFSFLPSSSASSPLTHTFIFSSVERAAHIHTDKHQQFVVNNEPSVLIQCVCVLREGGYSCPLTGGGGHHFFQSKRILSFLFWNESIFSIISVFIPYLEKVRKPHPFWYITPFHWKQSRGHAPMHEQNCLTEPEPVRWELRRSLTRFSLLYFYLARPSPTPSSISPASVLSAFILKGSATVQLNVNPFEFFNFQRTKLLQRKELQRRNLETAKLKFLFSASSFRF